MTFAILLPAWTICLQLSPFPMRTAPHDLTCTERYQVLHNLIPPPSAPHAQASLRGAWGRSWSSPSRWRRGTCSWLSTHKMLGQRTRVEQSSRAASIVNKLLFLPCASVVAILCREGLSRAPCPPARARNPVFAPRRCGWSVSATSSP